MFYNSQPDESEQSACCEETGLSYMYKLIIVDDEYLIRDGLRNYFPWSNIGFEVMADLENGKEALDYIHSNPVDVVLTDIKMPTMDGIEFARLVSQRSIPVKIVFMSGYKDFEYARKAVDYGVRSFVLKPTKYEQLYDLFTKIHVELDKEKSLNFPFGKGKLRDSKYCSVIEQVKEHVESQVKDATLESAAACVKLNPFYLSTLFRQKTGEKFSDYLLRVRMNTAANLLLNTNLRIYEISLAVGYMNSNSFSRTFKSFFDVSPKAYAHYYNRHEQTKDEVRE